MTATIITNEQAAARIAELRERRIVANAAPHEGARPDNDTHDRWNQHGYFAGQWREAHRRLERLQAAAEELAARIEDEAQLPRLDDQWAPNRYEDAQQAAARTIMAAQVLRSAAADLARQVLRSAPPDYQREIAAAAR